MLCGSAVAKYSSLVMLTGVCGTSLEKGVIGLSPVSCREGTSSDGRVLELFSESCLYGLLNGGFVSSEGPLPRLSGRE